MGLAMGFLFVWVQRFLDEPILATTASILVSFLVYIVAERLHVSGVLAVVVGGLLQGRYVPHIWSSATRLEGTAVWQTLVFLLNALVFVLIGLQLPMILKRPRPALAHRRGRRVRGVRRDGARPPRVDVSGRVSARDSSRRASGRRTRTRPGRP